MRRLNTNQRNHQTGVQRPAVGRGQVLPGVIDPISSTRPMPASDNMAGQSHVIMSTLAERGWTPAIVKKHLGAPDRTAPNPYRRAAEVKLYSVQRVREAEQRETWAADLARAARRKEAAARGRATRQANAEARRDAAERQALTEIGILPALFAVNRETKRLRDASRRAWRMGDKKSAGEHSARKRELYELKNQALEYLVQENRLTVVGYHVFNAVQVAGGRIVAGNCAEVLASDGYRFHRPAAFQPDAPGSLPLDEISAKPKENDEPDLARAELAVRGYLQGREEIPVCEWPARRSSDAWSDDEELDSWI
jgi:hypothetical protein